MLKGYVNNEMESKARYHHLGGYQQTLMNLVILILKYFSKTHLITSHYRVFMPCDICSDFKKISQQFRMKKDNLDKLDYKDKWCRSNKASG